MTGHRVFETQDGSKSLFSERFGVSFHSKYGAWQETQHVFIDAGLRYKAIEKTSLKILDIGFGTGLNALASFLFAKRRGLTLDYTGVDAYPVPGKTLEKLHFSEFLELERVDKEIHNQVIFGAWNTPLTIDLRTSIDVVPQALGTLEKQECKFEDLATNHTYDLIYFDAFAPTAQPELWTEEIFALMYKLMSPRAILVTYCAKGQVKRNMKAVGLQVERLKGPPGKREMTRALKE